jgi:hypothetical protein
MYETLDRYYNELLLEKSIKKLAAYAERNVLHRTQKQQADRQYKRSVLHRWLNVKERKVDEADQLASALF